MALQSNALTTVAELKKHLLIPAADTTQDDYLTTLINAASDMVENYCARVFSAGERTELYDGAGTDYLLLRAYPVATVAEVKVDGAAVTDYRAADGGFLRRTDSTWATGKDNVSVKYTAGYVLPKDATEQAPRTLPAALELAAILICKALQSDAAFKTNERIGDYSVSYRDNAAITGAKPLLAPYRARWC